MPICKSLRGAIATAGLLLIAVWIATVLTTIGPFPVVITGYLGRALVLAAAVVLGGTLLLSMLPANAARLAVCEH